MADPHRHPPADVVGLDGEALRQDSLHSMDAEMGVLGAVMLWPRVLDAVRGIVAARDFHHPVHAEIYATAIDMHNRGTIPSPVTLAPLFGDDDGFEEFGGVGKYLARLAASAVMAAAAPSQARLINELAVKRDLAGIKDAFTERMLRSRLDGWTARDQIAETRARLADLEGRLSAGASVATLGSAASDAVATIERAYQNQGQLLGVTTGLVDLDEALGGLQAPDLVVLAGRPGMGKTALALVFTLAAARAGVPVAFFSLEMSAAQLAERAIAVESGIAASTLHRGAVDGSSFDAIVGAQSSFTDLPIRIDDGPGATVDQIRATAGKWKDQGLGLVVIDHLGIIRPPRELQNAGRVHQITHATAELKVVAKEIGAPVVVISQLSRGVEGRENKRPLLADLRDSGSIEQDADLVLLLYRGAYYLAQDEPDAEDDKHAEWQEKMDKTKGLADLHIAKNRHGPSQRIGLYWDAERMTFRNLNRGGR